MHCATFFNILHMNKDLNIIESFPDPNERNLIKRLIITSILATDFVWNILLIGSEQTQ